MNPTLAKFLLSLSFLFGGLLMLACSIVPFFDFLTWNIFDLTNKFGIAKVIVLDEESNEKGQD